MTNIQIIETKKYIGGGVYAEFSGWDFRLTTQCENTIYLNYQMVEILYKWSQQLTNKEEINDD